MPLLGSQEAGEGSVETAAGQAPQGTPGGPFPGFGPAPPPVAAASSAGSSGLASQSDHTHAQSFGGAPPAVAAASDAGAAVTASRSDHTHAGVAVVATTDAGLAVSTAAATATITQKMVATWTLGATRWYAIDGVSGDDANAGFSDVSLAAAGAAAKRTFAGMSAIFPRYGAGRRVELVIRTATYAEDIGKILAGVDGYEPGYPIVRGTGTNATAGAVAFANTQADKDFVGAVTASGCNAAGYNPIGVPTTTVIQCQKVGGGAAAVPAEPASPLGWRIRFDSATTTVALRNITRTVVQVSGTDTVTVVGNAVLPAVPALTDTFYLEQAGVVSSVANIWGWAYTNQAPELPPAALVGIRWSSSLTLVGGTYNLVFCGAQGFFPQPGTQVQMSFAYFDQPFSTFGLPSGGGMRVETGMLLRSNLSLNFQSLVIAAGALTVEDNCDLATYAGCFVVGGVKVRANRRQQRFTNVIGSNGSQPTMRVSSPIASLSGGLQLDNFAGTVGIVALTSMGAKPAIKLLNQCVIELTSGITGSTGNTDVGLDLTSSAGSTVYLSSQPSVAGTAGEIRLAGGQIVTWAAAFATGIVDSKGNRIVATTSGLGVVATLSAVSGNAGVPTTSYMDNAASVGGGSGVPLRYPTSMRLITRLRLGTCTGTGAAPPTATLYKNGVATAMTCTLGAGALAGANVVDSGHPILFQDGDTFDVQITQPIAAEGSSMFVAVLEGPA